jgi:FAD/FMN-containing dehydrogenase
MDGLSYELVHKVKKAHIDFPFKPSPSTRMAKWYCVIEVSGETPEELTDHFTSLAEVLDDKKMLQNMFISENLKQFANIWDIRDSMGEALSLSGLNISIDVSLDINKFQELVDRTRDLVSKFDCVIDVLGFGHVGDGNLHLCVLLNDDTQVHAVESLVDEYVVEYVRNLGGSISAEHGVGVMKAGYLERVKGKEVMDVVRDVKMMFDPNNILNSGKVFDKF